MMLRRVVAVLATVAMGGLVACGPADKPNEFAKAEELFSLSLPDLEGKQHTLAQLSGQPVLVNFWATWCKPCVQEMPDLDALNAEFPNVAFAGIGIDSASNMQAFVQKVPVRYTLLEARSTGLDLMRKLGNSSGGLPFTVVISSDGTVARAIAGQVKPDDLRTTLQNLR